MSKTKITPSDREFYGRDPLGWLESQLRGATSPIEKDLWKAQIEAHKESKSITSESVEYLERFDATNKVNGLLEAITKAPPISETLKERLRKVGSFLEEYINYATVLVGFIFLVRSFGLGLFFALGYYFLAIALFALTMFLLKKYPTTNFVCACGYCAIVLFIQFPKKLNKGEMMVIGRDNVVTFLQYGSGKHISIPKIDFLKDDVQYVEFKCDRKFLNIPMSTHEMYTLEIRACMQKIINVGKNVVWEVRRQGDDGRPRYNFPYIQQVLASRGRITMTEMNIAVHQPQTNIWCWNVQAISVTKQSTTKVPVN